MQIQQTKHDTFMINFPSPSECLNNRQEEQQTDTLSKFIQKCPYFQFSSMSSAHSSGTNSPRLSYHSFGSNLLANQQVIQKFKKQIMAFAIQYGIRNQKTTSVFLKFLEAARDLGTQQLKKRQYYWACSYYAMCLGFVQPEDEQYLQKFVIIKIDILNKMMFSMFQFVSQKKQGKYFDQGTNYLQYFFESIKDYGFYGSLLKSGLVLIQLNYFYLGRMYKKRKNIPKAIEAFKKAEQIIISKLNQRSYQKSDSILKFCHNLHIKTLYKLSKCYRQQSSIENQLQSTNQQLALKKAQQLNPALYQYLNNKIRMHKNAKQFINEVLNKIEGKKKMEQLVLKQIQQANQKEIESIYDVYLDRPKLNYQQANLENSSYI